MADEWIDIIKDDLSVVKTSLKSEAHKYGWLHASVHIWFYTDTHHILFQKRSPAKKAFPNLWDVSVAGHIESGEAQISAALREVEEEIGLVISRAELEFIGTYKEKHQHKVNFIDNEIHYIYISKLTEIIANLKIQKEELTDLKLLSLTEYKKQLLAPEFDSNFVPRSNEYYQFVLNHIAKK